MQKRRNAFAVGWVVLALSGSFAACGTSSSDSKPEGTAGGAAAGKGSGASSAGGSSAAGQGPVAQAGAAPVVPVGGADQGSGGGPSAGAGETNAAGNPGAGGSGISEPGGVGAECMGDQDCAVFNDCCECDVGAASEDHPVCEMVCIQSACAARGVQAEARCRSNRCVFDLSCDGTQVSCDEAEPTCPAGQAASVVESCWGPCIEASQCREVTDCTACSPGTACVENQDSPLGFTQCVEVEASCAQKPTCECVDACLRSCSDDDGISCFCPAC
jgi:hypothetical protein